MVREAIRFLVVMGVFVQSWTAVAQDCASHPEVAFEVPEGALNLRPLDHGRAVELIVRVFVSKGEISVARATLLVRNDFRIIQHESGSGVQFVRDDKPSPIIDTWERFAKMLPVLNLGNDVQLKGDGDGDFRLEFKRNWVFSTDKPGDWALRTPDSGNGRAQFWTALPNPAMAKPGWTWHLPQMLDATVNAAGTLKRSLPCAEKFMLIFVPHPRPKEPVRGNGA